MKNIFFLVAILVLAGCSKTENFTGKWERINPEYRGEVVQVEFSQPSNEGLIATRLLLKSKNPFNGNKETIQGDLHKNYIVRTQTKICRADDGNLDTRCFVFDSASKNLIDLEDNGRFVKSTK